MQKNTSKKGFTLVEIMIVVVIIGLLAAMAVPAFNKVRKDSRAGAITNDARQIASAAQQYMLENNVDTVAHGYNPTTGELGTALKDYVRRVGKGYTFSDGNLTLDGTFSINHSQIGSALVFTPEGQAEQN